MAQLRIGSLAELGSQAGWRIGGHLDITFRALAGRQAVVNHRYFQLITGELHPFGNLAIITDPAATGDAIEPLVDIGAPAAAVFPTSPVTREIDSVLQAVGFESHEPLPAMAVEIDALAATGLPAGYTFTRTGAGPEGDVWAATFAEGYELPLGVARLFAPNEVGATAAPDATTQFFAILRDDKPVSMSLLHLADGLAGIYCVATLPNERGKGLGAHATAEPLRLASKLGYRVGVLQSSEAGHSMYEKLGFADFGALPLYVRIPGA